MSTPDAFKNGIHRPMREEQVTRVRPPLEDYPLHTTEKLRFADTDCNGHISNAVFAVCCQNERMELLHDRYRIPLPIDGQFVIARLEIDFLGEMRWPGSVVIGSRCEHVGRASLVISAHPIHALAATLGVPSAVAMPYLQARQEWRSRQMIAHRQVSAWRSAALTSVVITAAIGWTLAVPLSPSPALPHLPQPQATSSETASAVAVQALPAPKSALLIPTHRKE